MRRLVLCHHLTSSLLFSYATQRRQLENHWSIKTSRKNDGHAVELFRPSHRATRREIPETPRMADVTGRLAATAKLDALRARQRRIRCVEKWNAMG